MGVPSAKDRVIFFPGLNGVRAIAALAVVFSHTTNSLDEFGLNSFIFGKNSSGNPKSLDLAGFGVSMFFALSGFLITYLLLEEKAAAGDISLKKFYVRRALRIWPLYYAYLLCCWLVWKATGTTYESSSLLFYIFFAANIPSIREQPLPYAAHYWSLGVEEQFYLVWPWLMRLKNATLPWVMLAITLGMISAKTYFHLHHPGSIWETAIGVTRVHCMAMGGLGAYVLRDGYKPLLNVLNHKAVQGMALLVLLLVCINRFHVASFIDNEILAAVVTVFLIGQATGSRIVSLENRIFDYLGKISYGIYIVHILVIWALGRLIRLSGGAWYQYALVYFLCLAGTILVSALSYKYFERPFLGLKRRFAVVQSKASSG